MKKIMSLIVLAGLLAGCSEAPFDPDANSSNAISGPWIGMSYVTYPNEVDAPTRDSLEIGIYFQSDGSFSYNALGDWLTDPYVIYGTYELAFNTVVLTITDEIPYNSPLSLKGVFEMTINDNSLRLYQHPEHFWPTIHEVLLVRSRAI